MKNQSISGLLKSQPSNLFQVIVLIVLIVLIGLSLYLYYNGYYNALDWILISETAPSTIIFDEFNIGLFKFQVPADNYLVWQAFSPTSIDINYDHYYLFLIALTIGMSCFQAAYSRMGRYPFVGATLIFTLLYTQLHLEETILFGETGRTYVFAIIGVHLVVAFLFHSFFKETKVGWRIISFMALHGVMALILWQFSEVENPFMVIVPYASIPGILFSILFVAIVSQEVIFGILFLTTRSSVGGTGNGKHYLILGTIYLINLGLLTARNIGVLKQEIAIVDEFLILILSAIVAVFTFRFKQVLLSSYPFEPYGYTLFFGFGIVCFSFLSLQYSIINTPAIDAFMDIISYVHLGFGLMFFLYVILNFVGALYKNIPVYKIVYKEINFPYVSSLLAGLAVIAGLYFYTGKVAFLESKGGYYNMHGDVQAFLGDYSLAESYYKAGGLYGGQNLKSHYNLAAYARFERDKDKEEELLKKSAARDQPEFGLIALANFYKEKGDFFNTLFTLQNALKKHPESSFIRNNLAMQYAKTNILDSAIHYFNDGYYSSKWKEVSQINNWYIFAKSNQLFPTDSINELLKNTSAPLASNLVAYANLKQKEVEVLSVEIPEDSSLNSHSFPLLNNLALNQGNIDRKQLDEVFQKAAVHHSNDRLKHYLDYDRALIAYQNHDYNRFFRQMDAAQSAADDRDKGKYLNIIGLVSLKLNAPRLATNYFGSALQLNFQEAKINYGIALMEANLIDDAAKYWKSILNKEEDSAHHQVAFNQLRLLELTPSQVLASQNDPISYQYLRANRNNLAEDIFWNLWEQIQNDNMKADLLIAKSNDLLNVNDQHGLGELVDKLGQLNLTPGQFTIAIDHIKIARAIMTDDQSALKQLKNNAVAESFKEWPLLGINNPSPDSTILDSIYENMGFYNPFNVQATLMASNYFKGTDKNQLSYDILVNAIEINPYSASLLCAYALRTIGENVPEFGEEVLPRIKALLPPDKYQDFESEFYSLKSAEEAKGIWD